MFPLVQNPVALTEHECQKMEEQSAQNKVIETAFRLEQAMEKMYQGCWVVSKKIKTLWEGWYETIKEEEKLQSNKNVTVQCTTPDVHAVLRHAPADLRGGTLLQHSHVLVSGKPTSLSTDTPMQAGFRSFEVHTYCYGYRGSLEEIRRQSSVSVLSGPAIVITNVATASVCVLSQGMVNIICESCCKNCEDSTRKT